MGKHIELNFKETEKDIELYNWISNKDNIEEYIKSIIAIDMMDRKNKNSIQITSKDLDSIFDDPSLWD